MTQQRFGVNKVAELDYRDLIASEFPRKPKPVVASATVTEVLKRGSVVKRNSDGSVSLVTVATDVIYGVIIQDLGPGETGMAWVTGDFVGRFMIFGIGTWEEWDNRLRLAYAPLFFSESANN
jgi:hypothetical protein